MTRAPLHALLRRVSRMAEQMFDKQGDIDPIWLVETVSGEQQIIVSPVMAPSGLSASDYKDKLAAKMRETFADLDVVRYARDGGPSMRRSPKSNSRCTMPPWATRSQTIRTVEKSC